MTKSQFSFVEEGFQKVLVCIVMDSCKEITNEDKACEDSKTCRGLDVCVDGD